MKQFNKLFCLILFFMQSVTAFAQFSLPVYWTGGSGGGNTDVCGPNVITFTADPIPAGLTYQWVTYDYGASCGFNYNSQPVILSTGSPVLVYGMTGIVQCFAIDSAGQVQLQSFDIPMFNPDFNDGICSQNAMGGTVSVCIGDSALLRVTDFAWNGSLSVNGPGSVQWQLNGIDIPGANNLSYYATAPGTYKVLFFLSCGSGFSNEIQVNNLSNPPTPVILGDFNICQGSSTVLTANGAFSSYLWSTGETTQAITVNTGGPYTVSVSNAAGCTATATIVVTVNPNPTPQITGNTTLCLPQTTSLNGGAGYAAYQWNIGTVTQSITVSSIGTYTVTVTDINGCTGSDSIQVTGLVVTMNGNATICNGSSTNLVVQFAGTPPFNYSYSEGTTVFGPFVTVSNPALITVSPSVNTTYFLVSAGDANCAGTVTGSATITISSAPVITTGDSTLCQTQTTILDAGSGWTGYLWSTGATTQAITVSSLNNYTVTVTDASGCTGTDNILIGSQPPYTTALSASGPLGICRGDSVQLIAQTPMVFYTWYRNNILIPGATSSTFWATGTGKYKCQSLDTSGCAATSNQAKVAIVCFPPPPPQDKTAQLTDEINTVTLFPNPSQGLFNYKLPDILSSTVYLQVTDLLGNIIEADELTDRIGTIDLSAYPAGIYFLKVNDGITTSRVKLFKTN